MEHTGINARAYICAALALSHRCTLLLSEPFVPLLCVSLTHVCLIPAQTIKGEGVCAR